MAKTALADQKHNPRRLKAPRKSVTWTLAAVFSMLVGLVAKTLVDGLNEPWRSTLRPVIDAVASGAGLAFGLFCHWLVRRTSHTRWEKDRKRAEEELWDQLEALRTERKARRPRDPEARKLLDDAIAALEQRRVKALSAPFPHRPWELPAKDPTAELGERQLLLLKQAIKEASTGLPLPKT